MKPFLQELAEIYCQEQQIPLNATTFVFPSKRAGTFFTRYISNVLKSTNIKRPSLMPRICTITDIIEQVSDCVCDDRIDLLIILYQEYCKLQPIGVNPPEFDQFWPWGDTILSDFNDIDMYMADAEQLFKNLSDFKEIQTDYLTNDQKEVVERYFRMKMPMSHTKKFWQHFNPKNSEKATKERFLHIWQVLYPLYTAFKVRLKNEKLCYPAAVFRVALEKLRKSDNIPNIFGCKRVVFVGFNVLSTVEYQIFALLRDTVLPDRSRFADYYWDCTGPAMADNNNTAIHFINLNRKIFPSIYKLEQSNTSLFPSKIEITGCPSNSVQAKQVHKILSKIAISSEGQRAIHDAKVAVVLPDERLLMPILYSIPEQIEACNVTMGYPLKQTSTISFVTLFRRMQNRRRIVHGEINFFSEDISALLQHPFSQLLIPNNVMANFNQQVSKNKLYIVSSITLCEFFGEFTTMFVPADDNVSVNLRCIEWFKKHESEIKYISNPSLKLLSVTLYAISERINSDCKKSAMLKRSLDANNIEAYQQVLHRLDNALQYRKLQLNMRQVYRMADRMISSETVVLQGKPLKGLQLMGMLETRCIDFDYVIIPSMNEKIFPRTSHQRSFIPYSLRHGYGLATKQFEESIYAYGFYRMIARAKEVYILYDTRIGGLRNGDVSRYILQLQHIYKPSSLLIEQKSFDAIATTNSSPSLLIQKTGEVKEKLLRYFLPPNKLSEEKEKTKPCCLSASSLKTYLDCPLKFYFKIICNIRPEDDVQEFISPIEQGDIFHKAMERIYNRMPTGLKNDMGHHLITSAMIEYWLKNKRSDLGIIIDQIFSETFNCAYNSKQRDQLNVGQDVVMYRGVLLGYIENVLKADMKLSDENDGFEYIGGEIKEYCKWELSDGRKVNMNYIIDRLDRLTKESLLRISDYKTGSDEVEIDKISDAFTNYKCYAIFQLMLYANLYAKKHKLSSPIRLDIYRTRDLHIRNHTTLISCGKNTITDYHRINEEFLKKLDSILTELFDFGVPFSPTTNINTCKICDLKDICMQAH